MELSDFKGMELEDAIVALAKGGLLANAAKEAIKDCFKKGISVTVVEEGFIIRIHPDGTKTSLHKKNRLAKKHYTQGFVTIK